MQGTVLKKHFRWPHVGNIVPALTIATPIERSTCIMICPRPQGSWATDRMVTRLQNWDTDEAVGEVLLMTRIADLYPGNLGQTIGIGLVRREECVKDVIEDLDRGGDLAVGSASNSAEPSLVEVACSYQSG